MMEAGGPVAIKVAIAKLRAKLEPLVEEQGVAWEDALPVLETVDSLEDLQGALEAPEVFLQQLMEAGGPAAIKLAIAKLRPTLEPLITSKHWTWHALLPKLQAPLAITTPTRKRCCAPRIYAV
jgi:hypothetical protein